VAYRGMYGSASFYLWIHVLVAGKTLKLWSYVYP